VCGSQQPQQGRVHVQAFDHGAAAQQRRHGEPQPDALGFERRHAARDDARVRRLYVHDLDRGARQHPQPRLPDAQRASERPLRGGDDGVARHACPDQQEQARQPRPDTRHHHDGAADAAQSGSSS
jgi:hypothetical protein